MDATEQQQMILAIDKKGQDIDAVTKAWIDATRRLAALGEECRVLISDGRSGAMPCSNAVAMPGIGVDAVVVEPAA